MFNFIPLILLLISDAPSYNSHQKEKKGQKEKEGTKSYRTHSQSTKKGLSHSVYG